MPKLDEKKNGILTGKNGDNDVFSGKKKSTRTHKKPLTKQPPAKKYRIDVRMPDGRRITKSFSRKYDADKFKAELLLEKTGIQDTGIYIKNDVKFKDFVATWFETQVKGRKAKKTQQAYVSDLRNHILPILGEIQLKHIRYQHARLLENSIIETGKSARTVNKVMMEFKTILNDAVKLEYLLKSPVRGYPELQEEPRHLTFWSKEEIRVFIDFNKANPLLDLYIVALNTGLRLGEICGLCWDRVDFTTNNLVINRSLTRDGIRNTTKTHRGRYVPMNTIVRDILQKRLRTRISKFVFSTQTGKPLPYDHVTQRHFKKSQREAGLENIIRFHDLRHTFASHFMMNGGNIYTLQKLLGHTDIKTTMIYAHLDQDFLREAAEVVSFK
ncbi:tyrosine-type recombinase/integrase [Halobacteriovorax marinus]|nr:site-specific integrase [Halobacteriovorax marinus]